MKDIYIKTIASKVGIKEWQVENCVQLFEEGNTIPFISRYRKEKTGGLDDMQVSEIQHWNEIFAEMEKRKAGILATIREQGKLTDELRSKIENCVVSSELEDLYLPYRPKRRTRATVAKEKGLEPLADRMWEVSIADPLAEARKFLNDKVSTVEDALAGARDIVAERISETAAIRDDLRSIFRTRRIESKATKSASESLEAQKYRTYFNFSMPLQRIPSHNLLAILRAQNEGFLSVSIDADPEKCGNKIYYDFCQEHRYPSQRLGEQIREAVDDALAPIEIGGMVEGVQPLCGCNVGIFVGDGDRHGGDLLQLAGNGVVSQRRDTQQGQPAVAGYSNDVDPSRRVTIESVGGIEQTVECQGLFAHIGL